MKEKVKNVRGFFSYRLLDSKTKEILEEYQEENKIMDAVQMMFFEMVSGLDLSDPTKVDEPTKLTSQDFKMVTFALGDQGFDAKEGKPKEIKGDEKTLDSLMKTNGVFNGYTYQATWKQLEEYDHKNPPPGGGPVAHVGVKISTEGHCDATDLFDNFNQKGLNDGSSFDSENGLDVVSEVRDGRIILKFTLLEKTGNGKDFSEAALYVANKQDPAFQDHTKKIDTKAHAIPGLTGVPNLGTIFSKKTFKPVHKTNACVLEMEWVLDFNLSQPKQP